MPLTLYVTREHHLNERSMASVVGSDPTTQVLVPDAAEGTLSNATTTEQKLVCGDGDSIVVMITPNKLDLAAYHEMVLDSSCGAVSSFVGITRDNFENKRVERLEYEAYIPMALEEMKKIGMQVRKRWPDVFRVVFVHRIGLVPVLEGSIAIYISSPHRKASLDAVQYSIDELKARVPIWKKEVYSSTHIGNQMECQWKQNAVQKRDNF